MTEAQTQSEAERALVGHLGVQVPGLVDGIAVEERLSQLLRHKNQENSVVVLDSTSGTPLAGFAAGLRRDLAAVQACLSTCPGPGAPPKARSTAPR